MTYEEIRQGQREVQYEGPWVKKTVRMVASTLSGDMAAGRLRNAKCRAYVMIDIFFAFS